VFFDRTLWQYRAYPTNDGVSSKRAKADWLNENGITVAQAGVDVCFIIHPCINIQTVEK